MKRLVKVIGVAALTVLALTGCMEITMDLKVNSDETIQATMEYKYNKEDLGMLVEGFRETVQEQMNEVEAQTGDGTVTLIDDANYIGFRAEASGSYTDTEFLSAIGDGTEARITKDANNVITVEFPMGDAPMETEFGELTDLIDKFEIRISFDGSVIEASHDGAITGNSVVWDTDKVINAMKEGGSLVVRANESGGAGVLPGIPGVSGEGPAGISWLWWIIGGVLLLVIVLVVILIAVSSGKKKRARAQQGQPQQFQQQYPPQQGYPQGQSQAYPPQGQPYPEQPVQQPYPPQPAQQPYPPQAYPPQPSQPPVQQPHPPQPGQQYPPQPGQTGQVPPAPPAPPA